MPARRARIPAGCAPAGSMGSLLPSLHQRGFGMWNDIYYFIMVPMVYLAFATFVLGLVFKFIVVAFSPGIKGSLGAYPQRLPRPLGVLKDAFTVPVAFKKDMVFWFFIVAYHVSFALLVIGHLELIDEFSAIQIIPHQVFLGAGWVGIVLMVSTLYFLFRRFRYPYNGISVPEDFLILILLFFALFFGSHMNLASRHLDFQFDLSKMREYLQSLIALKPVLPEDIVSPYHNIMLALHVLFANIFLILFPFGKMVHSVFAFCTLNLKRK